MPPSARRSTLCAAAFLAACAPGRPALAPAPDALLARAIERAGGADALLAARALTWEGDATVEAGRRVVRIAGRWAVQPPDTAVVATYDVARGPGSTRALVVAAPRGWIVSGERFTPMPPALLASERDEFHLYSAMRLVPLRGAALTPVAPDSLGQPGFRATIPGRPDVELFFDRTGRLAHLRARVSDAAGGEPALQDVWMSGTVEAGGVSWPRELRITVNGAPFFALTLRTLAVSDRIDDPRLSGPP